MTVESNFMKNCEMDLVLCQTMDRLSTWLTLVNMKESPQNMSHDLTGGQQSSERGVYDFDGNDW